MGESAVSIYDTDLANPFWHLPDPVFEDGAVRAEGVWSEREFRFTVEAVEVLVTVLRRRHADECLSSSSGTTRAAWATVREPDV